VTTAPFSPDPKIVPWYLTRRASLVAVAALTVAAALPTLFLGFCTDDHAFRALLRAGRPPYDLFRFAPGGLEQDRAMVARGILPWWSAADLKIHFLRPLTGLFFAIDARVFGDHPFGYHLDSVAWYLALVVGVALLYRRLLGPASGALAALVFALAAAHTDAFAWVSARHIVMGAVPVVIAIALHVRGHGALWLK